MNIIFIHDSKRRTYVLLRAKIDAAFSTVNSLSDVMCGVSTADVILDSEDNKLSPSSMRPFSFRKIILLCLYCIMSAAISVKNAVITGR